MESRQSRASTSTHAASRWLWLGRSFISCSLLVVILTAKVSKIIEIRKREGVFFGPGGLLGVSISRR